MKGIRAEIYRASYNSPNNLLGNVSMVTVVGLGKNAEIFEATPDAPAVRIVKRQINGDVYHLEPVEKPEGVSLAFGGAFVETSDSRFRRAFPFYGAVALHDYKMT